MLLAALVACTSEGPESSESTPAVTEGAVPTWHEDVAPILVQHCGGCHTEGGVNFALDSWEAAAPMAERIAIQTAARTMPPWGAHDTDECAPPLPWQDDLRLSDDQIATLEAWAAAGAPEGDASSASELPAAVSLSLPDATQHIFPDVAWTAVGGADEFRCFVLDPALGEEAWLTGLQVAVDNSSVLHHIVVYLDEARESEGFAAIGDSYECFGSANLQETRLLGAWAPGATPFVTPEGTGIHVAAGSLIVAQAHYHSVGLEPAPDASGLDLRWTTERPEKEADFLLIGNADGPITGYGGLLEGENDRNGEIEFRIPAGEASHTETMEFKIPSGAGEISIFSVATHMHYVGVDMKIELEYGRNSDHSGDTDCLVQTPRWDFNWQRGYQYEGALEEVPVMQDKDKLVLRCTYDNTLQNPGTALALEEQGLSSPIDVYLGETTLDEMCLGAFGVVYQ